MATLGEFGTSDEMLSHICSQLAGEFTGKLAPRRSSDSSRSRSTL
jgi:hypothetical protein